MKLIIHRGSMEIGGSCVEVTAGNTRIILEVGLPLDYPGDKWVDPKGSKQAGIISRPVPPICRKCRGCFKPGHGWMSACL